MKRFGRKHPKGTCAGKFHYADLRQAQFEIDRALEFRGEILRAYPCTHCGKIHLTSLSVEEYLKKQERSSRP